MAGRNDPCPCGSGKKYKQCCLPKDRAAQAQRIEAKRDTEIPEAVMPLEYPESNPVFNDVEAGDVSLGPEVDPLVERFNAFWEDFIDAVPCKNYTPPLPTRVINKILTNIQPLIKSLTNPS